MLKTLFVLIALSISRLSYACSFDTDCEVGSKCLKQGNILYGVCVGGMNPGNSNDDRPVYSVTHMNHTYGKTCSFDTECGPGSSCYKSGGNISGTCM